MMHGRRPSRICPDADPVPDGWTTDRWSAGSCMCRRSAAASTTARLEARVVTKKTAIDNAYIKKGRAALGGKGGAKPKATDCSRGG